MILHVENILSAEQLAEIGRLKATMNFVDGKATAGWHARLVKENRQAETSEPLGAVQKIVTTALLAHPLVRSFAMPARISPPMVSSYTGGESYGLHVDEAIMGSAGNTIRTDLSVTVFLTAPDTYTGGELEVQTPAGSTTVKFRPGDAAIYPSTTLHRVHPVTSGERSVAVCWIQSLIRNAQQREILFDIDRTRRIVFEARGKTEVFDTLSKTYSNLQRMWCEL